MHGLLFSSLTHCTIEIRSIAELLFSLIFMSVIEAHSLLYKSMLQRYYMKRNWT